jgi:hypothetical protein
VLSDTSTDKANAGKGRDNETHIEQGEKGKIFEE